MINKGFYLKKPEFILFYLLFVIKNCDCYEIYYKVPP